MVTGCTELSRRQSNNVNRLLTTSRKVIMQIFVGSAEGWFDFSKYGVLSILPKILEIRLEFKWKGPFRFLPTGIFGITSGGGPLISVGIFRSKFAVPFLTNRFFALIREFGNDQKWQELLLLVGAV